MTRQSSTKDQCSSFVIRKREAAVRFALTEEKNDGKRARERMSRRQIRDRKRLIEEEAMKHMGKIRW